MNNHLAAEYPVIGTKLPIISLGQLPTPVSVVSLSQGSRRLDVAVKHDDLTGALYGGNKLRKLEYLFRRALDRGAKRVATFGTVDSNHALATALYARHVGLDCTCFLMHQSQKPGIAGTLRLHQQIGTEIVRFGGGRQQRITTLRKFLHGRDAWVIPLGGSSWLGSVGFVNAGLELAAQIRNAEIPCPSRIYVPLGTMGTAAGLAVGLALADLDVVVQAIRVTEERYASKAALHRFIQKIARLLHSVDPAIPADLAARTNIVCRDEFFGGGYAVSNPRTEAAVRIAGEQLGLSLETTYTGKAMAALLFDAQQGDETPALFWNSYNSRRLDVDDTLEPDYRVMPREFGRYFD